MSCVAFGEMLWKNELHHCRVSETQHRVYGRVTLGVFPGVWMNSWKMPSFFQTLGTQHKIYAIVKMLSRHISSPKKHQPGRTYTFHQDLKLNVSYTRERDQSYKTCRFTSVTIDVNTEVTTEQIWGNGLTNATNHKETIIHN